jgi:hypothetical protein
MWGRTAKTPDRAARAERRELRLEEAGVLRTVIDELTARVDLARRLAPDQADRFGLDDLLDRYADLAIAAQGGEIARMQLARDASEQRRRVRLHVLAWHADVARFGELAEEIAELIRLSAAVAVMPTTDELMRAEEAMCGHAVTGPRIEANG